MMPPIYHQLTMYYTNYCITTASQYPSHRRFNSFHYSDKHVNLNTADAYQNALNSLFVFSFCKDCQNAQSFWWWFICSKQNRLGVIQSIGGHFMEITVRMHSKVPRTLTTRDVRMGNTNRQKKPINQQKKPPSPEVTNIISPVFWRIILTNLKEKLQFLVHCC